VSGEKIMFLVFATMCIGLGAHMIIYPIRVKPGYEKWPLNYLTDGIARLIGLGVMLIALYWVHMFRTH
jgi:hypothetical protein